ncbi:polysaccharide biosynthesis C-terminal domain-containing protein [Halomontanus rarus]|uniref:oligosaccharide flippase family protein n=1 Tax=Halomontanus rarus TaxID=3034020 RepID=UPI0023E8C28A|nr:polysaccharide biosynthesis C-terminal domain-containing protein [Halovivax sp. TS33]
MSRNIVQSFSAIFGSKVALLALTVLTTPLLVRALGSGGYGDYAFMLSTLQWLMVFVYAGAFAGIRKYIAEDQSDTEWINHVFSFYLRLVGVVVVVVVLLILLFSRSTIITSTLGEEFVLYFVLLALVIPVKALFRMCRGGLMGLSLESYSEPLQIVDRLLFAGFAVVLFYVGGSVAAVLGARVITIGVAAVLAVLFIRRRMDLSKLFHRTPETIPRRRLVTYSVSTMVLTFLMISLYHLDVILLRIMVGSTETGYYRAALVTAEFLWFVPIAVQVTLLHSTSKMWVEERYNQLTDVSSRAVRYTLLFTMLLVLGTAGLAEPFLTLYFGPEFDSAVVPLLLLLPGALGFAIARPVFATSQGQENLRILILVTAVSALINAVLNLLFIPRFGANGAAVATSTAYGSMFFLHVWTARQLGFDPISDVRIGRVVATALIAAVPIVGLSMIIDSSLLALVVVPVVGALTFSMFAVVTGAIGMREIVNLASASPFPVNRLLDRLPTGLVKVVNGDS